MAILSKTSVALAHPTVSTASVFGLRASLISEAVRDAVHGAAGIDVCAPYEAELKGLQGTHSLYSVKIPA
ncbi:hypothetical protein [Mycobacterium sp.]|uniref:hypothetical protein n=1 Tax=Mycobacterium sp. TaxID=1785 RepID=UPI003D11B4B9